MAWVQLLSEDLLNVTVDDERKVCMLEVSSGGSVPRYVTVHFDRPDQLDELIRSLEKARVFLE
ncbi:hypothetical protein [Gorillibacterium sp. sgz5001074]|uniref:hypothetical protein n=1 Tax=Gorillibacterium sp. sgz5001074 TaxID=3446695 RepID=UPI003F67D4A4